VTPPKLFVLDRFFIAFIMANLLEVDVT